MVKSKNQLVNILALLVIVSILLIIILSASGFFDPGPSGALIWESELDSVTVSSGSSESIWVKQEVPDKPVSVQLTAGYQSGEIDSGYGLLIGQQDSSVAIGISPLGYVAIWTQEGQENSRPENYLLPWQPWPHLRTGQEINEILAILEDDQLDVLVNRERLWEGSEIEQLNKVGVVGISFGEETTLDFHQIGLFAD